MEKNADTFFVFPSEASHLTSPIDAKRLCGCFRSRSFSDQAVVSTVYHP